MTATAERLDQMIRAHRAFLIRLASGWTHSRADAEDVVQDASEQIAKLPELPEQTSSQRALMVHYCRWSLSVMRRRAAAERRGAPISLDRHLATTDDDEPSTAPLEDLVTIHEALALVRDALRNLTPHQRSAVLRAAAGWAIDLDSAERHALSSAAYQGRRHIAAHLTANGYPTTPHHRLFDDRGAAWKRVS